MTFRTRLAPSPTGRLHLGNARTFLVNWLMARQAGGEIILRIEDLDRARVKAGLTECAIEDLRWLGLDWDSGPVLQSDRLPRYERALRDLIDRGLVYPCVCTRKEIRAASAPHEEDEVHYPGTCRDRFADVEQATAAGGRPPALRLRLEPGDLSFHDRFAGTVTIDPSRRGGDFVIRSFDGTPSYQLAVALDDAQMKVTEVVRGDDLIPSTPRQLSILRALGLAEPRYTHLPLVTDHDGTRLAKRRGDRELASLREAGIKAGRVIARLARLIGIDAGEEVRAAELIEAFDLTSVPRGPIGIDAAPYPDPGDS